MRLAHLFLFVLASTHAKEEESNEVNLSRKQLPNLDANLRRALLKALTELENEDNEKKRQSDKASSHLDTGEKIVEKASASALSYFASTESPFGTEKEPTTDEITEKSVVVIQKSHFSQQKPITTLDKYQSDNLNEPEQILTSASSSFTSSSNKFSYSKSGNQSPNLVSNEVKATTKFFRLPSKVETTTVTTTTSTEESEAKVEDVQFFSAPLVAAFTVHQDERGLPKSVEPIYRTKIEQPPKEHLRTTQQPALQQQQQEQLRTQLALQEKQKTLEAEIFRLKQQQQHQNYLIRQQQILHQQQLQLQKQKILDEQTRLRQTQPPFVPLVQHTTQRSEFTTDKSRIKGSFVSFQPSISFTSHQLQSGVLPLNAQQLPVKSAIDFRSPFSPDDHLRQFNYLSFQQPPLENSVSTFNFVPTVQPQLTFAPPKHHRVFRQEASTGNFFGDFNQYSNQGVSFQPNNRFFRSSVDLVSTQPHNFNRAQPPIVNQQLNNLLYSSGLIRGKQQEDLNIVSKVLALNHYGGDYKFDSSNVNEQKVPAPILKKV